MSLWNIWSLIESYFLSLMRIFWVLQKGPTWRIMNSANFSKNSANSNPSSSTARKRCLSASSSSKKLGEVDGCSKRSPRFRNRNILQLNEKYLIWPHRIHIKELDLRKYKFCGREKVIKHTKMGLKWLEY